MVNVVTIQGNLPPEDKKTSRVLRDIYTNFFPSNDIIKGDDIDHVRRFVGIPHPSRFLSKLDVGVHREKKTNYV